MKLFRVENLITGKGLWYKNSGQLSYVGEAIDFSNKNLPMDFNPYVADNRFLSAAVERNDLSYWFSRKDMENLFILGYKLNEIEVSKYEMYRQPETDVTHAIFKEEDVISRISLEI